MFGMYISYFTYFVNVNRQFCGVKSKIHTRRLRRHPRRRGTESISTSALRAPPPKEDIKTNTGDWEVAPTKKMRERK
jgi:hypothetical protein